jgi:hypothetical protein
MRLTMSMAAPAVAAHLHPLDGGEAAIHHLVEQRQEGIDPLRGIDDLDHHRQIARQAQDLGGVQAAVVTEAEGPAQHRGAGQARLARLEHDRLVERLAVGAIVLAEKDAQQHGLFEGHRSCLSG